VLEDGARFRLEHVERVGLVRRGELRDGDRGDQIRTTAPSSSHSPTILRPLHEREGVGEGDVALDPKLRAPRDAARRAMTLTRESAMTSKDLAVTVGPLIRE
jgi:hypothetical protein